MVFFIAIISNVRSASVNNDYDFFKSMYRYITGSTINMSEKIKYIQLHKFGTYGAATLYGIFNLLDKFYSLIMNNSLTVIKEAMNFLEVIQTELIYINDGGNLYNFCTTGFLFFYVDFGIIGVMSFSCMYGFICNLIYHKLLKYSNLKYYLLYVFILESLVMFMITDLFSVVPFMMAIIYVWLFGKKYKMKARC